MFWISQDDSGWGVDVSPAANESTQVRLRMDKTQLLDAIQTGENYGCGHERDRKKFLLPQCKSFIQSRSNVSIYL